MQTASPLAQLGLLIDKAKTGDFDSIFELAKCYVEGRGGARKHLQKAARLFKLLQTNFSNKQLEVNSYLQQCNDKDALRVLIPQQDNPTKSYLNTYISDTIQLLPLSPPPLVQTTKKQVTPANSAPPSPPAVGYKSGSFSDALKTAEQEQERKVTFDLSITKQALPLSPLELDNHDIQNVFNKHTPESTRPKQSGLQTFSMFSCLDPIFEWCYNLNSKEEERQTLLQHKKNSFGW